MASVGLFENDADFAKLDYTRQNKPIKDFIEQFALPIPDYMKSEMRGYRSESKAEELDHSHGGRVPPRNTQIMQRNVNPMIAKIPPSPPQKPQRLSTFGAKQREEDLRINGLDRSITYSEAEWVPPQKSIAQDPSQRRPQKDRFDEMALREDFKNKNPSVDSVRRRAQFRKELYYHCLPRGQNYILLTTYGPDERFDILADEVGVEIWGVYESLADCEEAVDYIYNTNPHTVFFHIHTVQLGARIDLPPPNDGSSQTHHLNKHHDQIMKGHLKKTVAQAEYVDNRKHETVNMTYQKNDVISKYNRKLKQAMTDIGMNSNADVNLRDIEAYERINKKFERYPEGKDRFAVTPGRQTIEQQTADLKSLAPNMVEAFLECNEKTNLNLPEGYRVVYRIYQSQDGKEVVVRTIQSRK